MAGRLEHKVALIPAPGRTKVGPRRCASPKKARRVGCDINTDGNEETIRLVEAAGGEMTGTAPLDVSDPERRRYGWIRPRRPTVGSTCCTTTPAGSSTEGSNHSRPSSGTPRCVPRSTSCSFRRRRRGPTSGEPRRRHLDRVKWPATRDTRDIAHCAGKGAVIAISRAFAAEGAPHGIRAFSISPGPIAVVGHDEFRDPTTAERQASGTLLHRMGEVQEVANLALFLAPTSRPTLTGAESRSTGGPAHQVAASSSRPAARAAASAATSCSSMMASPPSRSRDRRGRRPPRARAPAATSTHP